MNKRGFTLLEVLIATFLAGVCIVALMEAFNRGTTGVGHVEDYTQAITLTQEQMEQITQTPFSGIAAQAKAPVNGFPQFSREVQVTTPHADLKEVRVITYWTVPNGETSVQLVTYVANA